MPVISSVFGARLFDKISILENKGYRFSNLAQRANVEREHAAFSLENAQAMLEEYGAADIFYGLQTVNETFWQIDHNVRNCEQAKDFTPFFVELAHSICTDDEEWVAIKRRNNEVFGYRIFKEN